MAELTRERYTRPAPLNSSPIIISFLWKCQAKSIKNNKPGWNESGWKGSGSKVGSMRSGTRGATEITAVCSLDQPPCSNCPVRPCPCSQNITSEVDSRLAATTHSAVGCRLSSALSGAASWTQDDNAFTSHLRDRPGSTLNRWAPISIPLFNGNQYRKHAGIVLPQTRNFKHSLPLRHDDVMTCFNMCIHTLDYSHQWVVIPQEEFKFEMCGRFVPVRHLKNFVWIFLVFLTTNLDFILTYKFSICMFIYVKQVNSSIITWAWEMSACWRYSCSTKQLKRDKSQ